jgi:hypothetical protein
MFRARCLFAFISIAAFAGMTKAVADDDSSDRSVTFSSAATTEVMGQDLRIIG